jgi:glutathione S-transferase
MIGQTANILQFLGPRVNLVPKDQASRLWVHQLQLTITDWVAEVGNTHHPIANSLYYEEQQAEAKRRTSYFISLRIPKFMGYYEKILRHNGQRAPFLLGKKICYADLSLFQVVEGLRYAFPKTMAKLEPDYPRLIALRDRVALRPRLKKYLASPRRIPFNQNGIFRHYPELDE